MLKKSEVLKEGRDNGIRAAIEVIKGKLLNETPIFDEEMSNAAQNYEIKRLDPETITDCLDSLDFFKRNVFVRTDFDYGKLLSEALDKLNGYDVNFSLQLDENDEDVDRNTPDDFVLEFRTPLMLKCDYPVKYLIGCGLGRVKMYTPDLYLFNAEFQSTLVKQVYKELAEKKRGVEHNNWNDSTILSWLHEGISEMATNKTILIRQADIVNKAVNLYHYLRENCQD